MKRLPRGATVEVLAEAAGLQRRRTRRLPGGDALDARGLLGMRRSVRGWSGGSHRSAGRPGRARGAEAVAGRRSGALPERERLVVTLYYMEDLRLKEIGTVLSLSESRVSRVLNARSSRWASTCVQGRPTIWRPEEGAVEASTDAIFGLDTLDEALPNGTHGIPRGRVRQPRASCRVARSRWKKGRRQS